MTKVLLVDDHEIFRMGLRTLLEKEPFIEIVGEAENGESALELLASTAVDVLVLDYTMPGHSGLDVLSKVNRKYPHLHTILLTASKSAAVISEALAIGVNGVVLKQDTSSQLVRAIESVSRGEQVVSTSIMPLVNSNDVLASLTVRERQVLRMIASGYRNREISEELSISLKTVDSHRTNLMRKLNLHSVVDLVELANSTGLLDPSI